MSEESPSTTPRGWGVANRYTLYNCTKNRTVEQVIIRAYLLIVERVSLTSLSLRCDFLGVPSAFKWEISLGSLSLRATFSKFPRSSIVLFLGVRSEFVCISRHLNR